MTRGRQHDSPEALRYRLASWRYLLSEGGPRWLVAAAPGVIAQIEADLASQGIEAGTAATTQIGADAPEDTAQEQRP